MWLIEKKWQFHHSEATNLPETFASDSLVPAKATFKNPSACPSFRLWYGCILICFQFSNNPSPKSNPLSISIRGVYSSNFFSFPHPYFFSFFFSSLFSQHLRKPHRSLLWSEGSLILKTGKGKIQIDVNKHRR